MSKTTIIIVVAIIVIIGLILWYAPQKAVGPSEPLTNSNIPPLVGEPSPATNPVTPEVKTFTVNYDATGFNPNSIEIKVGDTVEFKNTIAGKMWVASNPHPTHTDYPEFDAKKNYTNGETYSFTFTKAGTWEYHNHNNPAKTGTIIVK